MNDGYMNAMIYGGALIGLGPMVLGLVWKVFLTIVVIKALLTLITFRQIAEENLVLNRARTAHAEKSAAMLVAIRDRLEKNSKDAQEIQ